jgi:hypothetical protein
MLLPERCDVCLTTTILKSSTLIIEIGSNQSQSKTQLSTPLCHRTCTQYFLKNILVVGDVASSICDTYYYSLV